MVEFVWKFIDKKVKMIIWSFGLNTGCKFGLSVVLLSGGSQISSRTAHIHTKKNVSTPHGSYLSKNHTKIYMGQHTFIQVCTWQTKNYKMLRFLECASARSDY